MMKMKYFPILLALLCAFLFVSCSDSNTEDSVLLRLSNTSAFDYKNIVVNTSTGNVSFQDIDSGEKTVYQSFEVAYRYAYVQLEIDGASYILQPIDYVGETPLENGRYTYEISANESEAQYGRLSITLVEDN